MQLPYPLMELTASSFNKIKLIQQQVRKYTGKLLQQFYTNSPDPALSLVSNGVQALFATTQPTVSPLAPLVSDSCAEKFQS